MSDRENRIRATGFSKITDVPGKDYPAAILLLQKRWEDANGNVYAKRIGTMVTYYYHSTDWKNNATYEIMYGDITNRPEYKSHMMRLQATESYTVNSKGESVPIHEVVWGDEMMFRLICVFSSRPVMEEPISVLREIHCGLTM